MARKKRSIPEINAGSMADIAFLLLIFFLVTTSIDSDKGIPIKLPPKLTEDQPKPPSIKKRNIWEVLINKNDMLLVEGKRMDITQLCDATKIFISNPTKSELYSENTDKAVVSLKNDKGTSYGAYIAVQNELKRAYNELRDEYCRSNFNSSYNDLPKDGKQQQEALKAYPQKISEAEPENIDAVDVYK
jgi:biopolymer transport protein ExbD